ncbi:hypothetical protein EDD11_005120 [Mortierella claussenii]|nr:hypothetical protein EDD11_005120 [Mortierella claussenii]
MQTKNPIDQSLDDIIAANKLTQKRASDAAHKTDTRVVLGPRATKPGKVVKPQGSNARIAFTKRKEELFTETYAALMAPVKEIFTSQYIPRTGAIKLMAINTKLIAERKAAALSGTRNTAIITTPRIMRDSYVPSYSTRSTGPRRGGDSYRPGLRTRGGSPRDKQRTPRSSRVVRDTRSHGKSSRGSSSEKSFEVAPDGSIKVERPSSPQRGIKTESENRVRAEEEQQLSSATMMDLDDRPLSIKGIAPITDHSSKSEGGPATIEINNLDPETTAEDVKVVCSRFGEIRSCICSNGFSQVTYARKAAAQAAMETLDGKKADNDQILRVTLRKTPVFHSSPVPVAIHTPSPIAGPMKLISKAVEGTINNAGTLYLEQLKAAQHMLKVQQHRMAQLQQEEQRIAALRMQADGF